MMDMPYGVVGAVLLADSNGLTTACQLRQLGKT
jgi:hypothetical protein